MATQPVINGQTLQYVSDYDEEIFYKASVRRMASGALVRDVVTSANHLKLRFTLTWQNITITERNNVQTALGYLYDGTARAYTSPRNQSYTVVLAENGEPKWEVTRAAGDVLRYSGALVLEEV